MQADFVGAKRRNSSLSALRYTYLLRTTPPNGRVNAYRTSLKFAFGALFFFFVLC